MNYREDELSSQQRDEFFSVLKARFDNHSHRHPGIAWAAVQARLNETPTKMWSLHEMDRTGGEPDVVGQDKQTNEYLFYDCSPETPKGRRSLCYDQQAWASRKANKPATSAIEMAASMGIDLLSEEQYRELQQLGKFDLKTSSWVKTPAAIRQLGGALFADFRYGHVFVYHNGAESYYGSRAFRGWLKV
ncbi:DUF4256 domain-containing protein [Spirosoma pollinicola]|uniref:DUF4256 domain-containing protein n=1 Tax=Spirosoma pollinicola TaxID=2057025 RepID=A0A2K8Z0R3_9BACT|nr:DUF4256 domain-containing protein [Spirosoma pollinicola]AUD03480.1 DUF4256 domain-containing protein [Spirosoma pollinicola]